MPVGANFKMKCRYGRAGGDGSAVSRGTGHLEYSNKVLYSGLVSPSSNASNNS